MKLSRKALTTALGLGMLLSTSTLQAGVPVVDGAAITQMITNHVETGIQWGKEAAQWAKELQAYQQQLEDLRSGNYMGLLQSFTGTYFTQGGPCRACYLAPTVTMIPSN